MYIMILYARLGGSSQSMDCTQTQSGHKPILFQLYNMDGIIAVYYTSIWHSDFIIL